MQELIALLKAEHHSLTVSGPLRGVCSALLVPRTEAHRVDYAAMERLLDFQQTRGIKAFALNGATGEYTRSSCDEIRDLTSFVKARLGPNAVLVLGVGGADQERVQALLDIGRDAAVDGYLVPVPYYFPLEQQDIVAFVQSLDLHRPTYLYNLPSFTTGIAPETALSLFKAKKGIVGVKDSSGSLDTVRLLSDEANGAARIIGNDGALHEALQHDVCDGVVSGVAGVLPELMQRLYTESASNAISERSLTLRDVLMEYISWLNKFPVPWGLKVTAEFRGLFRAEYSLPLSQERIATATQFKEWLALNQERLLIS